MYCLLLHTAETRPQAAASLGFRQPPQESWQIPDEPCRCHKAGNSARAWKTEDAVLNVLQDWMEVGGAGWKSVVRGASHTLITPALISVLSDRNNCSTDTVECCSSGPEGHRMLPYSCAAGGRDRGCLAPRGVPFQQ